MRTQSEIDAELQKLATTEQNEGATSFVTAQAVATQALAWVLGDELSPSQHLADEIAGASEAQSGEEKAAA